MLRIVARVLGILIGLLAIVGLFIEGQHLLGVMNVDLPLDILRIILAGALLYVGFAKATASAPRTVVMLVGIVYLVMGLTSIWTPTLFGALPNGLTTFDVVFHLGVGAAATMLALLSPRAMDDRRRSARAA